MKPVLLVVDDDPLIVSLMDDILQNDYTVLAVDLPSKALHINPEEIHGLVTDWNMKELSGLELIQRLRARRPDLPVIIVSGEVSRVISLAQRFHLTGGWENIEVVTKPFSPDTLLQTIREVTGT